MSTITLYYNEYLNTTKNVMYSASANGDGGFAAWLTANSKRTDKINNFQYVKNALTVSIKIPASQSLLGQKSVMWNYAAIKNDNDERTYYYYITEMTWTAKMTIRLTLGMDTIATYWSDIQTNLSPATTIYREHRDRFESPTTKPSAGSTIIRKIDEQSEGIQIANKRKVSDIKFVDPKVGFKTVNKWYLIYMTQVDANNLNDNPIKCYLCADKVLKQETINDTFNLNELNQSKVYLWPNDSSNITVNKYLTYHRINYEGDQVTRVDKINYCSFLLYRNNQWCLYSRVEESDNWQIYYLKDFITTTNFTQCYVIDYTYFNENICDVENINTNKPDKKTLINIGDNRNATPIIFIDSDIQSIDYIDRTDSRLNMIIELPYCPSDGITYSNGVFVFDNSVWEFSGALRMLKLKDLNADFLRTLTTYEAVDNMSYTLTAADLLPTSARNDAMESKIYHSDFNTIKWSYDGYDLTIARERLAPTSDIIPNLSIKYKQSNNLSSNLLFDVSPGLSTTYKQIADNENIIISRRNNELPIYQSSYLNYMRNGYNYDKKAIDIQRQQQAATMIVNAATSLTSLGLGLRGSIENIAAGKASYLAQEAALGRSLKGKEFGNWFIGNNPTSWQLEANYQRTVVQQNSMATQMMIGNVGNNIGGIFSVITTQAQQENSMNAKLASLAAESASTSGSDDLNLLNYYNGNKLHKYIYDLSDQMKAPIFDLFYFLGYATNDQRKPNLYTRTNWNFIMCNPQWTAGDNRDKLPFEAYINDISARFNAGLTVFHNNNDWEQTKNNIEVSLLS